MVDLLVFFPFVLSLVRYNFYFSFKKSLNKGDILQLTRDLWPNLINKYFIGNFKKKEIDKKRVSGVIQKELCSLLVLSIRGERMKNVTDSFVSLGHWPSAGSFGFNTDILATNPINLSVVLGVLIFFGKGVCASCIFQE